MKVVLDTNVFISGIFWETTASAQIIESWKQGKFTLVSSLAIVQELVETLREFRIQLGEELIRSWETIVIENSFIVEPAVRVTVVRDDPSDNKFFEAAVAGGAELIISQDRHLLKIGEYQHVKVVLPQEFLKMMA